jgi:cold shock CspA family protein
MMLGTIISWNEDRGYGFVRPDARFEPDFFFKIKYCKRGFEPEKGIRVTFDTADDPRSAGKEMAIDVTPA